MIERHLADYEAVLKALSGVLNKAGHPQHKGTPREYLVKHFLEENIGGAFGIGTGEIIDQSSQPDKERNQIDIIIYNKEYPKLSLGGGIDAFFIESVIATIEVKSNLTEKELRTSLATARRIKGLKSSKVSKTVDFQPNVVNYVFGFTGPKNIETTFGHLQKFIQDQKIELPALAAKYEERMKQECPLVDMICVLDQGIVAYDTSIIDLADDDTRAKKPDSKWVRIETQVLLWFYLHLTSVLSTYASVSLLNPNPYLSNVEWEYRLG